MDKPNQLRHAPTLYFNTLLVQQLNSGVQGSEYRHCALSTSELQVGMATVCRSHPPVHTVGCELAGVGVGTLDSHSRPRDH